MVTGVLCCLLQQLALKIRQSWQHKLHLACKIILLEGLVLPMLLFHLSELQLGVLLLQYLTAHKEGLLIQPDMVTMRLIQKLLLQEVVMMEMGHLVQMKDLSPQGLMHLHQMLVMALLLLIWMMTDQAVGMLLQSPPMQSLLLQLGLKKLGM